jgi:Ca2+-binding EF-hand superfamily protein
MTRFNRYALAAMLALALPLAATAQDTATAPAGTHMTPFAHMLKKMDTNGDGKISLAEWQAAATARFDALDTQHTGSITAQQLANAGRGQRSEELAEREVARIGSNGTITKDQYLAASQARFAKLDKNGDGFITADEVPAGHMGHGKGPNATDAQ